MLIVILSDCIYLDLFCKYTQNVRVNLVPLFIRRLGNIDLLPRTCFTQRLLRLPAEQTAADEVRPEQVDEA